jgi:hypothetical protein
MWKTFALIGIFIAFCIGNALITQARSHLTFALAPIDYVSPVFAAGLVLYVLAFSLGSTGGKKGGNAPAKTLSVRRSFVSRLPEHFAVIIGCAILCLCTNLWFKNYLSKHHGSWDASYANTEVIDGPANIPGYAWAHTKHTGGGDAFALMTINGFELILCGCIFLTITDLLLNVMRRRRVRRLALASSAVNSKVPTS